jgi:hypothetical protein
MTIRITTSHWYTLAVPSRICGYYIQKRLMANLSVFFQFSRTY